MHRSIFALISALTALCPLAGCDPLDGSFGDFDLPDELAAPDPFDSNEHTVGELGNARFQIGSCFWGYGPCSLHYAFMAGHSDTLLVDVISGDTVAAVESSDPTVLAVAAAGVSSHGYDILQVTAQSAGAVELRLRRADGSILERVAVEVRVATAIRWQTWPGDDVVHDEQDGDGQLQMGVGQDTMLIARPIDATGRILAAVGDVGFTMASNDGSVVLSSDGEGNYFAGLAALTSGQTMVTIDAGSAHATIAISVSP
jgi:hypothetical protein